MEFKQCSLPAIDTFSVQIMNVKLFMKSCKPQIALTTMFENNLQLVVSISLDVHPLTNPNGC